MKKTILLFVAVLLSAMTYGQTANGFNFKALVTDNGNPVANSTITVRVTFKAGSSVKWKETHANVHTDANGIFSVIMGEGTRVAGVASFDKVDWNVGNMNYTIEVNTGSGYHALVSNEYFKRVPYAKLAERLSQTDYDVVTNEANIWVKNDGTGDIYQGLRLSHGSDDWYLYMKNDNGFALSNDGVDVLKIADSNNNIWLRGKLTAPASGDADMKAYIYGKVYHDGSTPGSTTPNTNGFSVQKLSTGKYRITFTTPMSHYYDYVIIGTIFSNYPGTLRTDAFSNYVDVYTYTASGVLADRSFQFVVYKK